MNNTTHQPFASCLNEWQSRSSTEIVVKSLSIHLTTLALVSQYASRLGLPLKGKIALIVCTACFPVLVLADLLNRLMSSVVDVAKAYSNPDTRPCSVDYAIFLLCRGAGMCATSTNNHVETAPDDIDSPDISPKVTIRLIDIPWEDHDYMKFVRPTIRWPRSRSEWIMRICSSILIIAFICQALSTIILLFRRTSLNLSELEAVGVPIKEFKWTHKDRRSYVVLRNPIDPVMRDLKTQATSLDIRGTYMAITGLCFGIQYLFIRLSDIEWVLVSEPSSSEVHETCTDRTYQSMIQILKTRVPQFLFGFSLELAIAHAFRTSYGRSYTFWAIVLYDIVAIPVVLPILPFIYDPSRLFIFIFSLVISWQFVHLAPIKRIYRALLDTANTRARYLQGQRFTSLIIKVCEKTSRQFLQPILKRSPFLIMAGCKYLLSSLHAFLQYSIDPFVTAGNSDEESIILPIASHVLFFSPVIPGFISFIIVASEQLPHSVATSHSGCVYNSQLRPWMWKDPLADILWAF